jgi:adenylosuccinate lyase
VINLNNDDLLIDGPTPGWKVRVEVEYFISLLELGVLPAIEEDTEQAKAKLREIYTSFTEADAQKIKDIEKVPLHHLFAPSLVCRFAAAMAGPSSLTP